MNEGVSYIPCGLYFEDEPKKIIFCLILLWKHYRCADDKECLEEFKSSPVAKKPRTVGVVEPRVVVKIPLTKIGSSIAKKTTGVSSGSSQGMYKNRVKDHRNFFDIATFLPSQ